MAIYGIDCSSNNGLVDWTLAASRGVQFAFYRKNLCLWQDRLFAQNSAALIASGIRPCLYTVWDPKLPMEPQFQAFIKDIEPEPWWRIAIDVERSHSWGVNSSRVMNALMYMLHSIAGWHGKRPLIYTNRYYWNRYYSTRPGWGDDWGLWVANYQAKAPAIPVGWTDYVIWQFSADGNRLGPFYGAKSAACDVDIAREQFVAQG